MHGPLPQEACVCVYSVVSDSFATPGTVACQASLPMGFQASTLAWVAVPFFPAQGSRPCLL